MPVFRGPGSFGIVPVRIGNDRRHKSRGDPKPWPLTRSAIRPRSPQTKTARAAKAVVDRETADAADLDDAIGLARQLWRTLDMLQRPDAMSISDNEGNRLYSGTLDTAKNTG